VEYLVLPVITMFPKRDLGLHVVTVRMENCGLALRLCWRTRVYVIFIFILWGTTWRSFKIDRII